jgi:hypothetical protein
MVANFLGFGWYCHEIGFHAGIIGVGVAMIAQDVEPVKILIANRFAIENKLALTIEIVKPSDEESMMIEIEPVGDFLEM